MIPSTEELKNIVLHHKNINKIYIDIDNPVTIQDKISWLEIYDINELKTKCADKIKVHEYVQDILGEDICVPIYKIYDSPDDINLDILPSKVMIKCNHGSGMNFKVMDKNVNLSYIKSTVKKWLNIDYSTVAGEYHYTNIERKVFSEKFISDNIVDYKMCCFNGEPKILQICFDRNYVEGHVHCNYYDENLQPLYISDYYDPADYDANVQLPKKFDLMKEYARKLSANFKFVRVDFYEVNDILYLSELTFTPASGLLRYANDKDKHISIMLGNMLKL